MKTEEKQRTTAQACTKPYCEYVREVQSTIDFLEYLGGRSNPFNPYREAITRLEGFVSGAKMVERELDL